MLKRLKSGQRPRHSVVHGAQISGEGRLPKPGSYEPKGQRPPYMNPNFQVPHQNEPTAAHPVSQHKQFKGHTAGASIKIGRY